MSRRRRKLPEVSSPPVPEYEGVIDFTYWVGGMPYTVPIRQLVS